MTKFNDTYEGILIRTKEMDRPKLLQAMRVSYPAFEFQYCCQGSYSQNSAYPFGSQHGLFIITCNQTMQLQLQQVPDLISW